MIYLASPYSHPDENVRIERAYQAARAAGSLMAEGLIVFSPVAHGHAIALITPIPTDWEYWQQSCTEFLQAADGLMVLTLEGWEQSVGVQAEIAAARQMGLPVEFIGLDEI